MSQKSLIFCALDTADLDQAKDWAAQIGPVTGALKLGLEFVNAFGPQGIEAIRKTAPDAALFIDLKFHDIPNTVAGAVRTICANFAPAYLNVHASGGAAMMEAAKEAVEQSTPSGNAAKNPATKPPSKHPTKLLAVTILTSLSHGELCKTGYAGKDVKDNVVRLAKLAQNSGLDGVVCSALEIAAIRKECGPDFELIVPGIRPQGAPSDDQARIMTPQAALAAGATHLVIGRPITGAPDPAKAARDILADL